MGDNLKVTFTAFCTFMQFLCQKVPKVRKGRSCEFGMSSEGKKSVQILTCQICISKTYQNVYKGGIKRTFLTFLTFGHVFDPPKCHFWTFLHKKRKKCHFLLHSRLPALFFMKFSWKNGKNMKFTHFCLFLTILTLFRPIFISVYIGGIYISRVFLYIAYIQILYTFTVRTRHFYKNKNTFLTKIFRTSKTRLGAGVIMKNSFFRAQKMRGIFSYFYVILCHVLPL